MDRKNVNQKEKNQSIIPKNENFFYIQRTHKGISLRNLSKKTGISRYILQQIESGNFEDLKIKDLITLCNTLNIHVFDFFKTYYQITHPLFDENQKILVQEIIHNRITKTLNQLKQFCSYVRIRIDDFDLAEVLSSPNSEEKLIILNHKLSKKVISVKEALEHFPPKYLPLNKRRSNP